MGVMRNIPAHAGKTHSTKLVRPPNLEHPRARGENRDQVRSLHLQLGTSPRTRGKHLCRTGKLNRPRNIPAHAGKTLIDVRFLVPEGHFTFGFIFPHHGGVKFILS